jgi:hypothetical protein
MKLRVPAVLVATAIASCGDNRPKKIDAAVCAIDAPAGDAGFCIPCGDVMTGSDCHACVDPCGNCPPGCEPLV